MPSKQKNLCFLKKLNFCTTNQQKSNYESLSYDEKLNHEEIEKQRKEISSTSSFQKQIELNRIKLLNLNNMKKQATKLNLIGNQIMQTDEQEKSQHHHHKKVTSTIINLTNCTFESEIDEPNMSDIFESSSNDQQSNDYTVNNAYSNYQYQSQIIQNRNYLTEDKSSSSSSFSTFQQTQCFTECNSQDFKSVNSSFFDHPKDEDVYVCIRPYEPKVQGDINLKYTDRVKLLHSNQEFALVKNLITNNCGYVPISCLINLSQFIKNL